MSAFLYRRGSCAARRRYTVIITWILLLIGIFGGSIVFGSRFDPSFNIPGTPAQVALDMLEERFPPAASNASIKVIYVAPKGTKITTDQSVIEQAVADLSMVKGVDTAQSPFASTVDAPGQAISNDGSMAYVTVTMDAPQANLTQYQYNDIQKAATKS